MLVNDFSANGEKKLKFDILCMVKMNQIRNTGLVVKGGDSKTEGHEFKSQCRILDGHVSHYFDVKFVLLV